MFKIINRQRIDPCLLLNGWFKKNAIIVDIYYNNLYNNLYLLKGAVNVKQKAVNVKRYLGKILSVLLVLSLSFNVFIVIKNNFDISGRISDTITEVLRCISDAKECLQRLIDSEDPSYQSKMIYVINGKFSTLYHLCHANGYIYSSACSDFECIGATFIGPAGIRSFTTSGIYEDFKITENEHAYVKELIALLDKVEELSDSDDAKDDLSVLNSNFEDMNEQLWDTEKSPFRLIQKSLQSGNQ